MSELETADVNRLAEDIASEVVGELRKYSVSMNMPDEQEAAYYDWSTRIVAMIIRAVKGKRSAADAVIAGLEARIAELQAEAEKHSAFVFELRSKNAALNLALFHVENGLAHPDESIRKLIEAAMKAKETERE